MSVKPSPRSNSSATYCGATHKLGLFTSLMVVTSGGASWASEFGLPRRPAAPTDESVVRKRRRFWIVGMARFFLYGMESLGSLASNPDREKRQRFAGPESRS